MALHEKLARYSSEGNIYRFNKILNFAAKDLSGLDSTDWQVEHIRVNKVTDRERFFTLLDAYPVEQIMTVSGHACGVTFTAIFPMSVGLLLPYRIEILLNASIDGSAIFRRGFFWPWWDLVPQNETRLEQLRQLSLPGVNLRHTWGGYKYVLKVGHEIVPVANDPTLSRWTVHSGFQGFVIGVGPRIAKYVKAAGRLETLLKAWSKN